MNLLPRYRPLLTLALVAVAMGFATAAWAQSKTGPLVLAVSQAGKASLAGETQFVVELRNTGPLAVTLPARPGWDKDGALELRVSPAAAATAVRSAPSLPDPARNTRLTASRRGVALPAGEALGIYRTVKTSDLFPATGDYEVVVVYRGLGGGDVMSAPLRVSVTP